MKDILSQIIAHKKEEVRQQKELMPASFLHERLETESRVPHSMRQALAASDTGIIAEFKRRSPSKGWINREAEASLVPPAYEKAGAAALSILADRTYFGGDLSDLHAARPLVDIPVLCKEFIIDEYQLLQARLSGADAVLLIAACLGREECAGLTGCAHRLGLEVLLEVHTADELEYMEAGVEMAGVNNRNLGTFDTDMTNSFRLADALRAAAGSMAGVPPLLVSESGISKPETIHQLRGAGFRGFLIGETFMRAASPGKALESFIHDVQKLDRP